MLRTLCRVAALAILPTWAIAEQPVTSFTLDNGMEVVVVEDNRAPVVKHMVWYRVGAADEPRGISGIAHFFEHLMFKGTDEIPDGAFSKIVKANGGVDNAFTSYDYTAYHQRIAADRLELVMKMEADRMTDLVITQDHVDTEREVVIEERNSRTDNSPNSQFWEQMNAALYMNHAYGVPVIGWRREIELINYDQLMEFYRRYYAPDNAILVVAGDVTPERVRELAEKYYGPIKPSGNPPDPRPGEPPQLAPRRMTMEDPRVGQDFMARQYLVSSYDPKSPEDSAALLLASQVLGDGITSRLSQKLTVEQKVTINAGAWFSPSARDYAEFGVYAVPAPGNSLEDIEAAVDAVIADLIETGPTQEELDRLKRVSRANRIFAQDSISSQADLYGRALALGLTVEDVTGWDDVVQSITVDQVREALANQLEINRSVTGQLKRGGEKS